MKLSATVLSVGVIGVSYEHQIGSLEVAATGDDGLVVDVELVMTHMKNVI